MHCQLTKLIITCLPYIINCPSKCLAHAVRWSFPSTISGGGLYRKFGVCRQYPGMLPLVCNWSGNPISMWTTISKTIFIRILARTISARHRIPQSVQFLRNSHSFHCRQFPAKTNVFQPGWLISVILSSRRRNSHSRSLDWLKRLRDLAHNVRRIKHKAHKQSKECSQNKGWITGPTL